MINHYVAFYHKIPNKNFISIVKMKSMYVYGSYPNPVLTLPSLHHSMTKILNILFSRILLELYTTVLPAVFLVSVFTRYQICWIFSISDGIVPPFLYNFPLSFPLFPKGGWGSSKRGPLPPF